MHTATLALAKRQQQRTAHAARPQVPCSLLLLGATQHESPQLLAAGAVEVQVLSHSSSLRNQQQLKQVVILRNQEQQPCACAEISVCLQSPYSSHDAAKPGSMQLQAAPLLHLQPSAADMWSGQLPQPAAASCPDPGTLHPQAVQPRAPWPAAQQQKQVPLTWQQVQLNQQ